MCTTGLKIGTWGYRKDSVYEKLDEVGTECVNNSENLFGGLEDGGKNRNVLRKQKNNFV